MKKKPTESDAVAWVLRLGVPVMLLLGGMMLAGGLAMADSRMTVAGYAPCPVADGAAVRCRANDGDGSMRRQSGQLWLGPYRISPARAGDGFLFPHLRDAGLDGAAPTTRPRMI